PRAWAATQHPPGASGAGADGIGPRAQVALRAEAAPAVLAAGNEGRAAEQPVSALPLTAVLVAGAATTVGIAQARHAAPGVHQAPVAALAVGVAGAAVVALARGAEAIAAAVGVG